MKTILIAIGIIIVIGIKVIASVNKTELKFESNKIFQFKMNDINGESFDFASMEGKVVLLVNVASKCGFTSQYKGLQKLYNEQKNNGLVIIGVPSNDFGGQEPGTHDEIKSFCKMNFNVSFPILEKSIVIGKEAAPLYQFLTSKVVHPKTGGKITWNFNKFLINKDGHVVKRYSSFTRPGANQIKNDIASLMSINKESKNEEI